jgi:hypothetical protein
MCVGQRHSLQGFVFALAAFASVQNQKPEIKAKQVRISGLDCKVQIEARFVCKNYSTENNARFLDKKVYRLA